jgi:hypothetical protein
MGIPSNNSGTGQKVDMMFTQKLLPGATTAADSWVQD